MVCYGAGLRVSDVVKLTAADIEAERMTIRIQQGRGTKTGTPYFHRRFWTSFAFGRNHCHRAHPGCFLPDGGKANTLALGRCKKLAAMRGRGQSGIPKAVDTPRPSRVVGAGACGRATVRFGSNAGRCVNFFFKVAGDQLPGVQGRQWTSHAREGNCGCQANQRKFRIISKSI